jgi:hypothetical protein
MKKVTAISWLYHGNLVQPSETAYILSDSASMRSSNSTARR